MSLVAVSARRCRFRHSTKRKVWFLIGISRIKPCSDTPIYRPTNRTDISGVEYTYGTPMSVLPSFAERKRVWVFRRCTLSYPADISVWINTCFPMTPFTHADMSARHLGRQKKVGPTYRRELTFQFTPTYRPPTFCRSANHGRGHGGSDVGYAICGFVHGVDKNFPT